MTFTMKRAILFYGLAFTSLDVLAHTNGSHDMGLVEGLIHLVTQPSHVLLLAPVIVLVLGYYFRRLASGRAGRD